jgi:hypothetical protein
MKRTHRVFVLLLLSGFAPIATAQEGVDTLTADEAVNISPEAHLAAFENASFLSPVDYREKYDGLIDKHTAAFDVGVLSQIRDESGDPRRSITADELWGYVTPLKEIAEASRADGEILWGRVQGTRYERRALEHLADELRSFGFTEVAYDKFPSQYPQWRPSRCVLAVTRAPGISADAPWLPDAPLTGFVSGTTPDGGIEAEVVYVGEGSNTELRGRDLGGKLVLLRSRAFPSAHITTVRAAFSRLATGRFGRPAGVIVWWDAPYNVPVAGRVGASGGGDAIGASLPWIGIGNEDGYYLRKLMDRADPDSPVRARLDVQGRMESGQERMSGNVYAMLPGSSGKYILIPSHVDGYFYGVHDNGAGVAINLALAKYYRSKPIEERRHGLIFLFQGDHEVPGAGGTVMFAKKHEKLLREQLLMVLQPEHPTSLAAINEAGIWMKSNSTSPLMLMITNRSPKLIDIFARAIRYYNIPTGDKILADPFGDVPAFYPPFLDIGEPISAGWIETSIIYHTTADIDYGMVDARALERIARAHAYVIDEVFELDEEDLREGETLRPQVHFYYSDALKMFYGNF